LDIHPTFGVFFMAKYDERFKLKTVEQYLSGNRSCCEVASASGLEESQLRRWIASYREHGQAGLAKKFSHYSAQFKLEVLERVRRDDLSDSQAAALYDIRSVGDIGKWRRQYDEGGVGALEPKRRGRKPMPHKHPPVPVPQDMTVEQLREELAYLRAENDYLKKLKALIDAERTEALVKKRKLSKD